jgi:hypothetical protein
MPQQLSPDQREYPPIGAARTASVLTDLGVQIRPLRAPYCRGSRRSGARYRLLSDSPDRRDNGDVVFVADDLTAWLIGMLADAGRRKLLAFVLGDEQERALRQACGAALTATADDLRPGDAAGADEVAMVIGEVFSPPAAQSADGRDTLLEELQAGIAAQLAVLGDRDITAEPGLSSADMLGLTAAVVTEKLAGHLVREIIVRGLRGGPLQPLANQLGHDRNYLQGLRLEGKVDHLDDRLIIMLAILDQALADERRHLPIQGTIRFIDPVAHLLQLSLGSNEDATVIGLRFVDNDRVVFVDDIGSQIDPSFDSATLIRRWVRVREPYPNAVKLEVTCKVRNQSRRWIVPVEIAVFPELLERQPRLSGKFTLDYPPPDHLRLKLKSPEPLTFLEARITAGYGVRFLRASGAATAATARWEDLAAGESARWPVVVESNHSSEIELAISCRGRNQEKWYITRRIGVPRSLAHPGKPKFDVEVQKVGSDHRLEIRLRSRRPLIALEAELNSSTGVKFVGKDGRIRGIRARHGSLEPGQAIRWRVDLGDWITQFFGLDLVCSGPAGEKWKLHESVHVPPKFQRSPPTPDR